MRCVPKINCIYWLCLALASVFGANAGDFLSDAVGLGHTSGIPYLAVALAAVFLAEHFLKYSSALYFWAAIIIIRASATNVGDAFHDFNFEFSLSVPSLCLLLGLMVIVWRQTAAWTREQGFIPITATYWITMFVAGVLGTVAGDAASYPLGLGNFGAMIAFGVPMVALLFVGRKGLYTDLGFYWLTVALIRSAGTAAGDLVAHKLDSIALSTALSGVVFVGLVVAAYEMKKGNNRLQGESLARVAE